MKKIVVMIRIVLFTIVASQVQAQKSEHRTKESLHVKIKDQAKLDIYVDGKKFDFPMELLDNSKIESVNVVKGERARKEYNAKNGVVLVTTKISKDNTARSSENQDAAHTISGDPMVLIDGKESNQKELKALSPDDIESINILKGEQALQKYNAPDGVIIVTMKKGKY